ncbi:TonB-dependent receptor [Rhodanobacter ginsengisoli]|uniref:TonB-dependent receptor n=1 Tax=Rhodanobacter ginsengisoli TaxID=418646 RepID=A0ABW0QQ40_9GAMM
MKHPELIRLALATAIAAALPNIVWAAADQNAPDQSTSGATPASKAAARSQQQAASQSDAKSLQAVVVTGNALGVRKIDASYNIVSANLAQIKEAVPVSTADLLKISPGIWPESSGGQTGANIEIAGFPGGGDAPFFTNMVNGTPLYGMPSLSFMDSSSLFRLDDTIERVEIVQGGPGAVFGPGQMGATANFILRQGTETPSGDIGVTYGSEGMYRVDGFYGFPIAENWYGSVGGFWRKSDGVRDPQFPADKGGQLTATLTHDMDNGTVMFWARALNDKNQFITPIPLIQGNGSSFSAYPGFDPLTDTYYSKAIQHVNVPDAYGRLVGANLANGRGGKLNYFGGSYDGEFGGWTISDHFVFGGGDLNTNALFSGSNPKPLSYYLYGCNMAQPAGFCDSANQPVDGDTLNYPTSQNVSANYVGGGTVAPGQSVIHQGWWYIQKHLRTINNDFRISKEIFEGNTLTVGLYLARSTDNDNWSLGNQMLMTNTPNAKPITLSYDQNGQTIYVTNPQGFVSFNGNYDIAENGKAINKALYLSDSWKIGRWLFDASGRVENLHATQNTCNRTNVDLDGNPNTLYDNTTPVCNGTFDHEDYNKTHPSFTVGANYELADNMSVYIRANTGAHFDDFDNGIRGAGGDFAPMAKIRNLEGGFKYQSSSIYLDLSAYHRTFTGLQYQETDIAGNPIGKISTYGSSTKGVNLNATWSPIENLKLALIGNYMDGHYTGYNGCAPYFDINGNSTCIGLNGQPLQRQPKFRFMFTPSYKVVTGWGDITGWVTYSHIGQRYEDQSGLQPLGAYHTFDAGIVANYQQNWQFSLLGSNLTNEIGLTEGNARVFGVNTGVGGVILARPLQGREVNFQAKYRF